MERPQTSAEDALNSMLRQGVAFEDIEAWIDLLPIGDEEKSVLWLWAWGEQPRAERQTIIAMPG